MIPLIYSDYGSIYKIIIMIYFQKLIRNTFIA